MCYLCKESPCVPSCPSFSDSSLDDCSECGSSICHGQQFYNLNGYKFHEECVSLLNSTDILEILEIKPSMENG